MGDLNDKAPKTQWEKFNALRRLTPLDLAFCYLNDRLYRTGQPQRLPAKDFARTFRLVISFADEYECIVEADHVYESGPTKLDRQNDKRYVFKKGVDGWIVQRAGTPSPQRDPERDIIVVNGAQDYDGCIFINLEEDGEDVVQVVLFDTRSAIVCMERYKEQKRGQEYDFLPCRKPDGVEKWAHVAFQYHYQIPEDGSVSKTPLKRDVKLVVSGEGQPTCEAEFTQGSHGKTKESKDAPELRWKKGKYGGTATLPGGTESWDIYFLKNDSKNYMYLHDVANDNWQALRGKRSQLAHARAHLEMRFPDARGEWEYVRTSFDNANNDVALLARINASDYIEQEIIVKRAFRHSQTLRNERSGKTVEPREVFLHSRLMGLEYHAPFVRLLHISYHDSSEVPYYMYLEYAKYGSLNKFIHQYQKYKADRLNNGESDKPNKPADLKLPEQFVWLVFRCLVDACYNMQHDPTLVGKEAYVHIDIKPPNILLYEDEFDPKRESPRFPIYALPKLADFDHYRRLHHEQHEAPSGTPSFMAPEQAKPFPSTALGTDVFQIGIIILGLMRNNPYGVDLTKKGPDTDFETGLDDEEGGTDEGTELWYRYSRRLRKLVLKCLTWNQRSRPELKKLFDDVRHHMMVYDKKYGSIEGKEVEEVEEKFWLPFVDFWEEDIKHRGDQLDKTKLDKLDGHWISTQEDVAQDVARDAAQDEDMGEPDNDVERRELEDFDGSEEQRSPTREEDLSPRQRALRQQLGLPPYAHN